MDFDKAAQGFALIVVCVAFYALGYMRANARRDERPMVECPACGQTQLSQRTCSCKVCSALFDEDWQAEEHATKRPYINRRQRRRSL